MKIQRTISGKEIATKLPKNTQEQSQSNTYTYVTDRKPSIKTLYTLCFYLSALGRQGNSHALSTTLMANIFQTLNTPLTLAPKADTAHENQPKSPTTEPAKRNTNPGPTLAFSSAVMNLPRVDTAAPLRRLIYKTPGTSLAPRNQAQRNPKVLKLCWVLKGTDTLIKW